ncbi:MAG: FumA C-terminus/TtdB family hydratase beta subunit [Clostridiales bacterium]|nr:FumA C-terminus/TtdB family hydratase beta subunit [Clostridiales bacterium]
MPQSAAREREILNIVNAKKLRLPADNAHIKDLSAGEIVLLSGTLYTARDQAHKRLAAAINDGKELPFPLGGAAIYYCGPTPAAEGQIIGSCGPTTSARMDAYTPLLLAGGLKVMIGKGVRSDAVTQAIKEHGAVYFSAIGGAAALYQSTVRKCELIAYPDLGCEAVYKLTVEDFPAVVTIV